MKKEAYEIATVSADEIICLYWQGVSIGSLTRMVKAANGHKSLGGKG